MISSLKQKISSIRDSLATLPINNKKNVQKYLNHLDDLILEYSDLKEKLLTGIKVRYDKLYIKNKNDVFDDLNDELLKYRDILACLNDWNTPYEKCGLDKWLFKLTHFYQNDFEELNKCIRNCLDCFEMVGIKIEINDFSHNPYLKEYMSVFLLDSNNGSKLKELFEDIYWKCPNIIFYMAINFKYLYYKNEKKFINYYRFRVKNILKDKSLDDYKAEYRDLVFKLNERNANIGEIINKLFSKEYNLKDFSKQMEETYYKSFTDVKNDFNNIIKFYDSLCEYSFYLKNKYIIDKFKKIYVDREKYKNVYKNTLKEISKINKEIIRLNNSYSFNIKYFNNKSKLDSIVLKINEQLELVRVKYELLDNNKFYEKIATLNDNVSYLNILELAGSYFVNARKIIKEEFSSIGEEEISNKIDEINNFLADFNMNILKNIKVMENIDIAMVISDRYKLLNFNVSKESIINNVDSFIDYIEKLKIIEIINKSNITYSDLEFLCRVNDMIS